MDFDDPRDSANPSPDDSSHDFDGHPTDAPNGFWNMLKAAVMDGRVGGLLDGGDRYPAERYAVAPEPTPAQTMGQGRCPVEGRPFDDHISVEMVGLMQCSGLALFDKAS